MKVVIANDHRGVELKRKLIEYLNEKNYIVENYGTDDSISVDYPVYAFKVGEAIVKKEADLGILICGTGIGMSIAANKVKGIRCAHVTNVLEAQLCRMHNNANVIAISENTDLKTAEEIVLTFLQTDFSNEERHINRINLIDEYEVNNA